jgi:hypothetical protein
MLTWTRPESPLESPRLGEFSAGLENSLRRMKRLPDPA